MSLNSAEEASNSLFLEGRERKETARKDLNNLEHYLVAAERFSEAAAILDTLKTGSSEIDSVVEWAIYADYYRYEEYDCRAYYYYELRDTDRAEEFGEQAVDCIRKSLNGLENLPKDVSQEARSLLEEIIPKWRYYLRNGEIACYAYRGRKAFETKSYIEALDCYREMARLEEKNLELIEGLFEPAHERIARGRAKAALSNAFGAIALVIMKQCNLSEDPSGDAFELDSLVEILRNEQQAYAFGMEAFQENPEWKQYFDLSQGNLRNITRVLESNPSAWNGLYLAFEDNPEFLKIMKSTNIEQFKQAELNRIKDNKPFISWAVGSFWLIVLIVVVALVMVVMSFSSSWYYFLIAVFTIEVLLLVVGALILKSSGDISEAGFLDLLKMALRFQLGMAKTAKDSKPNLTE